MNMYKNVIDKNKIYYLKKGCGNKCIVRFIAISLIVSAFMSAISSDKTGPWWNANWQYWGGITSNKK